MGILTLLIFIAALFKLLLFTFTSAGKSSRELVNATLTRKKQSDDLVIETTTKEYTINFKYIYYCGAEGTEQNFPDVYINFVAELDEKGTSLYNKKMGTMKIPFKGYLTFKANLMFYKAKNVKDRRQFEIHFCDKDPPSNADDYLRSFGKYDLSKAIKGKKTIVLYPHGGEVKTCNKPATTILKCNKQKPMVHVIIS